MDEKLDGAGRADASAGAAMRAHETPADAAPIRLRAPDGEPLVGQAQRLVLLGAALLACGAVVFVAVRWEELSRAVQAAVALMLVAAPHLAAALVRARRPRLAEGLHAAGTLMVGGALVWLGRILGVDGYGPEALLVWAAAVGAGWWLGQAETGERGWVSVGGLRLAGRSLALVVIQVALAGSAVGLYAVQRAMCPRVWAQAEMVGAAGRYAELRLTVDGCRSTLPSAFHAVFPRDVNGVAGGKTYTIRGEQPLVFLAELRAEDGRLEAIREEGTEHAPRGETVRAEPGTSCAAMRLEKPVDVYAAKGTAEFLQRGPGQVIWAEVTVPPKGMPRVVEVKPGNRE